MDTIHGRVTTAPYQGYETFSATKVQEKVYENLSLLHRPDWRITSDWRIECREHILQVHTKSKKDWMPEYVQKDVL